MVATDAAGQPVANLAPADLKVSEDGSPINQFGLSSAHDLPLLATLIYDTSESNQKSWRQMQRPVTQFAQSVIRPQNQLWIAAFDSKLQFRSEVQGADQLNRALNVKRGTFNATAFNDALLQALRDQPVSEAKPRRAAMIVFSDGEDNYSLHSARDVIAAAQQAKVAVYTIHRRNNRGWGNGDSVLKRDCAENGRARLHGGKYSRRRKGASNYRETNFDPVTFSTTRCVRATPATSSVASVYEPIAGRTSAYKSKTHTTFR